MIPERVASFAAEPQRDSRHQPWTPAQQWPFWRPVIPAARVQDAEFCPNITRSSLKPEGVDTVAFSKAKKCGEFESCKLHVSNASCSNFSLIPGSSAQLSKPICYRAELLQSIHRKNS